MSSMSAFSNDILKCKVTNGMSTDYDSSSVVNLVPWDAGGFKLWLLRQFGYKYRHDHTIGDQFTINRSTGEISGKQNSTWVVKLVEAGSDEQSTKIILHSSGGYIKIRYFEIDVYKGSKLKPLRIMEFNSVYVGHCIESIWG